MTLRTALQKLELLGYVDRKRGIGTFVVGPKMHRIDAGIERLVSISDIIRQRGHIPGSKEVQICSETATEDISNELQIKTGDPVTVIKRIRTMDGNPLLYDHNVFPASILPQNVTAKAIGESLFNYILNEKKLNVTHAVARLVPKLADNFLAEKLGVKTGTLLIQLVQVLYINENDIPIWQSTQSFHGNRFSWHIVRTR
jgi:GntR family transcriptional regulator